MNLIKKLLNKHDLCVDVPVVPQNHARHQSCSETDCVSMIIVCSIFQTVKKIFEISHQKMVILRSSWLNIICFYTIKNKFHFKQIGTF